MRRRPGVLIQSERTLLALLAEGPTHGYPLAERWGWTRPTTYGALNRLEAGGYLAGEWYLDGWRTRRVYALTAKGRRVVDAN